MTRGLILFAHGSRDPRWAETIEALADRCRTGSPDLTVRCAYLEFMQPDLANAVAAMRDAQIREVVVVPVFLAAGGHVLRDLPQQVQALERVIPGVSIRVESALGVAPRVLDAMAQVCLQAATGGT